MEAGKKNPVRDDEVSWPAVKHGRVTEVSMAWTSLCAPGINKVLVTKSVGPEVACLATRAWQGLEVAQRRALGWICLQFPPANDYKEVTWKKAVSNCSIPCPHKAPFYTIKATWSPYVGYSVILTSGTSPVLSQWGMEEHWLGGLTADSLWSWTVILEICS